MYKENIPTISLYAEGWDVDYVKQFLFLSLQRWAFTLFFHNKV